MKIVYMHQSSQSGRTKTERVNVNVNVIVAALLCLAFLSVLVVGVKSAGDAGEEALKIAAQLEEAFARVADKVAPSVVSILAQPRIARPFPFRFRFPFPGFPGEEGEGEEGEREEEQPQRPEREGEDEVRLRPIGSGIIVDAKGYVLTNRHVVRNQRELTVGLWNRKEYPAKLVGSDAETDLAVVKIEPDANEVLRVADFGDSDNVRVGQWAIAMGSPFGLNKTMTVGIISAIGRRPTEVEAELQYMELIQTDAAINPGNSGGPLCTLDGKVIGINTAIMSRTGVSMGVGFAIPINVAKFVMEQLIQQGKVVRGWLGVSIADVNANIAKKLGLKEVQGVIIGEVVDENSPAARAGLKKNDVILSYNGRPVHSVSHLQHLVGTTKVRQRVPVKIVRDGKEIELGVEIGERPAEMTARVPELLMWRGMGVIGLNPRRRERTRIPEHVKGVIVVSVEGGSPAGEAGVEPGDVIITLNDKPVASMEQFSQVIKEISRQKPVTAKLYRKGKEIRVLIAGEE